MTPYKILPEGAVSQQPIEFITTTVIPWIRELTACHQRFHTPPWRPPTEGGLIVIKSTRWLTPAATPEIAYYAATNTDGLTIATTAGGEFMIAWVPTPVPLPIELEALAVDPITRKLRL